MKKATLLSRDPRGSKTGLGHPRGSAPTMTVHVDPAALWDSRRCATHQQSVRRDGLSAPPADQLWSATASGRRAAADGERTPPSREKRPRVLHKCARARPRAETATQKPRKQERETLKTSLATKPPLHRHPSAGSRRDYTKTTREKTRRADQPWVSPSPASGSACSARRRCAYLWSTPVWK